MPDFRAAVMFFRPFRLIGEKLAQSYLKSLLEQKWNDAMGVDKKRRRWRPDTQASNVAAG